MTNWFLVAFLLLVSLWYLTFLATRLDRLHHRVETSWANLDVLLQKRAAVALEIAHSDIADPASSLLLTGAAYQARDANIESRSAAESGLSGALGLVRSKIIVKLFRLAGTAPLPVSYEFESDVL
jgi:hypothetical protein